MCIRDRIGIRRLGFPADPPPARPTTRRIKMAGEPRKKSIIAVTVAAVGLLTLAAVIPVLAPDGVFAHTAGPAYNTTSEENSSGSAPTAGTREEYRETMLDMLRDHMGLEGSGPKNGQTPCSSEWMN